MRRFLEEKLEAVRKVSDLEVRPGYQLACVYK